MKRLLTGLVSALFLAPVALAADAPTVGTKAPDWTLPSDRGGHVSLHDFKGKQVVVMAFYPKDETPGCTKEMQAFSKDAAAFAKAGAAVFGISRDSLDSHHKFRLHCALDLPLLSDDDAKVATTYGAVMPIVGLFKRKLFLIDKQGTVRRIIDGMPDNATLLADIAAIAKP